MRNLRFLDIRIEAIEIFRNNDLYRNAMGKIFTIDQHWLHQSQKWLLICLKSHFHQETFFILCFKLDKEDIYVSVMQFQDGPYIGDFLVFSEMAN